MQGIRAMFAAGRRPPAASGQGRPLQSVRHAGRWFGRRKPTLFQRCLAVHIYHASPRSVLQ